MRSTTTNRVWSVGIMLLVGVISLGWSASQSSLVAATATTAKAPTISWEPLERRKNAPAKQIVWVALEDAKQLVRVDLRKRRVLRRVNVSGNPHNITVNDRGLVAATLWSDERLELVRGGWRKRVHISGAPHDVKIGGGRIVVANQGAARLNLFSLRGKIGKRRSRVGLKTDPHDVALSPGGDLAWASLEGSDDLAVVNLKRKKVRRYVSTGRSPHDLLFSPTGRLWVTDWNGAVHVYSRTGMLLKSRSLGVEAHHLAFTPDGSQVWITDHGAHRVFVLGTRRFKVIKRLRTRGSPHHVAITPDGKKAVVADHDRGLLIVYRVATLKRVAKIKIGAGPHGVWSEP